MASSLLTYNRKIFAIAILPWLKHPEKINKAKLIVYGKGTLDNRFKKILSTINDNSMKTARELAVIIGKKKLYAQLKFLYDYGYIERKDYPMKYYIIKKGMNEISEVVL